MKRTRWLGIPHLILRVMFTGQLGKRQCSHLDLIEVHSTDLTVCKDCLALGDTWPELRMCMICGYVGCCDDAKNQHAKKHFLESGHPLIRPVDRGVWYDWMWCYEDSALLSPVW